MQNDKLTLLTMCDTLMSEYSWTLEYVLSIPHDIIKQLYSLILDRKQVEYRLLAKIIAVGSNAGFSGKMNNVNKMFKKADKVNEESADFQIEQMRKLWLKFNPGKDIKILEEQLKKGQVRF